MDSNQKKENPVRRGKFGAAGVLLLLFVMAAGAFSTAAGLWACGPARKAGTGDAGSGKAAGFFPLFPGFRQNVKENKKEQGHGKQGEQVAGNRVQDLPDVFRRNRHSPYLLPAKFSVLISQPIRG